MSINTNVSLPFDTKTLLVVAIMGIIIKFFLSTGTTKEGTSGPASATVWGYGLTTMSLLGLMVIIIALSTDTGMEQAGIWKMIKDIVSYSFPVLITTVVLAWIVVINFIYMKRINQGKVAPEFNEFSFLSTILIVLQLLVVFKYMLNELNVQISPVTIENETLNKINNLLSKKEIYSVTIILSLLNLIFAGMMQVIVQFFSTDG